MQIRFLKPRRRTRRGKKVSQGSFGHVVDIRSHEHSKHVNMDML